MDSKLPKLSVKALVLSAILGVVIAVIVYQAQIRGLVPVISGNPVKPETLKIQTLIQEENAVTSVVEKSSSAIVSISLEGTKIDSTKTGTGFIIDSKGIIITNKYIVSESGQYVVTTKDGQKFEVRNIYKDPNLDLSLLLIDASSLKVLDLGDSSELKLGQTVIAIGQMKQAVNVSTGVVSKLSDLIQTDAVINSENSGGPLLSLSGQVVGVNLAISGSPSFGSAIPINSVKQLIASTDKGSSKPVLGLIYKFISSGAAVQDVTSGGAADKAGIKIGDIITKINGKAVDMENVVSDTISQSKVGQQIELSFLRSGQELTVKAALSASSNQ